MIVKKMPILQGFPDFETVKNLSGNGENQVDFAPLFYDIETTGLGRNSSFLYMIGAVCYEGNEGWQLYQWLAPDFREEKQLLDVLSTFVMADDTGLLCDAYNTAALGEKDCTRISVMEKKRFPAWLAEHENTLKSISDF